MTTKQPRPRVALGMPDHVPDYIKAARATQQSMQANAATFPGATALLTKLGADIDALDVAETATQSGTHGAAAARDEKLAAVKTDMTQVEATVQAAIDASPAEAATIAAHAALHLHKTTAHGPHGYAVRDGDVAGAIKAQAPSAGERAAYNWQISLDGGKTWSEPTTTNVSHTGFTGLPVGSTVLVRSRSTVKGVTSDWSTALSFVVR
jgi:hypothetical protein